MSVEYTTAPTTSLALAHYHAWRGIVVKQLRRFLRTWVQTLLPSLVTAGLFLVVFGGLVGREIGTMAGVPYADFLMPGLVMLAIITNAYSNTTLALYGARLQKHIEEILVSPAPTWVVVSGFATGGIVRGLLVGALVVLLAVPFSGLQFHAPLMGALMAVLTATLFSLAGLINGVFARSFDHTSVISTFVLTPLIYLGGLFYPIERLPEPWQSVAALNPLYFVIEGFRYALLGTGAVPPGITVAVLTFATVVTGAVAGWLLHTGVRIRP